MAQSLDCFAKLAMTKALTLALTLTLVAAGCRDQRATAPTAEESDQLNEAEAMLNEQGTEESGP